MKIKTAGFLFISFLFGGAASGQDIPEMYMNSKSQHESVEISLAEVESALGFSIRITNSDATIVSLSLSENQPQANKACRNQTSISVLNEHDEWGLYLSFQDIYSTLENGDLEFLLENEYRELGYKASLGVQELEDCKKEGMKWYRIILW